MMRLAALQMQARPGDQEANFSRIAKAAREAAEKGASLLVTPELALSGYGAGMAVRSLAQPRDGEMSCRLATLAKDTGVALLIGMAERDGDDVYNSAFFFAGDRPPFVYRKTHLYGAYERALFRAGVPCADIVQHGGQRLGILICYDVEFPENVRRLAKAGARIVLVPTALPQGQHARFIARQIVPVRAFENQIHVVYVNHCGGDGRFSYAGLATVAAPDGNIIAAADALEEALLMAELEPEDYADSMNANTYLADLDDCRRCDAPGG